MPRTSNTRIASRSTFRLTPKRSARSRSTGSRAPGGISPVAINRRICSTTSSYSRDPVTGSKTSSDTTGSRGIVGHWVTQLYAMREVPMTTELRRLAADFWDWRAATAPASTDDLTRMDRPTGWLPDWSASAVDARRQAAAGFRVRLAALALDAEPVAVRVDGRLIQSAIDRVYWELDLQRGWRRHPGFYVEQAVVPIFEAMLPPGPFNDQRAAGIAALLAHLPEILAQARTNLGPDAVGPFATLALRELDQMPTSLAASMAALAPHLSAEQRKTVAIHAEAAVAARRPATGSGWPRRCRAFAAKSR